MPAGRGGHPPPCSVVDRRRHEPSPRSMDLEEASKHSRSPPTRPRHRSWVLPPGEPRKGLKRSPLGCSSHSMATSRAQSRRGTKKKTPEPGSSRTLACVPTSHRRLHQATPKI